MAVKIVELPEIGPIRLYKRRGSKNVRLSITNDGQIRVTLPSWAPYETGIKFITSKKRWLLANRSANGAILSDKARIGKAHVLRFFIDITCQRPASRISDNEIRVTYPDFLKPGDPATQLVAKKACVRALRTQAEQLLPAKVVQLARLHGYSCRQVAVKQLKSRWGSCDSHGNITLNLFLMQLPWKLINYVILHELAHTKHMNHSPEFWAQLESTLHDAKALRKNMRKYRSMISPL